MTAIGLWWSQRSEREQRLLAVMFCLLFIVLAWLLVVRPLAAALEAARLRHGEAVVALAEAKARAAPVPGRATNAPLALPIDSLISRTATEAGFTGAQIAGQGPARASVTLDSARPQAFFAWIAGLERQGLEVERLQARANPDRTVAAETVLRAGRR